MPEKERSSSKRGGRTSGGSSRDERSRPEVGNRATSMRSMRSAPSGEDMRGGGVSRSGSSRSLRSGGRGGRDDRDSGSKRSDKGGGGGSERGLRSGSGTASTTGSATGKAPLERQTSNNEDSMAMLLGLAGKKKPRKRSDSDSSSSSSSASSREGGPPLTGEKSKPKVAKDGPLLRAEKQKEEEGLALDLSNRSGRRADDDTSSFGSSRIKKGDTDDMPSVSKLAFPTSDKKMGGGAKPEKNTFVSRPDLRNVDQSVNLRDVEAGRKGKGTKDYFQEASSTSFTSSNASTGTYNRNSFSRNKKNPYLKVSPMENAMYTIKSFCRNLMKTLCHRNCLIIMFILLIVAIVVPLVIPKKSVSASKLLVDPTQFGTSDAMVHPVIDTIEKEGITYLVPVVSKEEAEERIGVIQKILMEHDMETASKDAYAREALAWIAEYDPAQMAIEADEGAILQRYALAVLFFATHPGTMANRTTDQAMNSHVDVDELEEEVEKEQDERRIDSYGANWMIDENICTWQGVECLYDNRVVHLNMSGTTLQGTLPQELALLKELSRMDLSHNYLEGSLPEVYVERLDKLEYLLLQDNLLSGKLPETIGEWSDLVYANLASNKFTGTLPESLDALTELQLLFLQENLMSGPIPSMKGMKALEYLYLNNNDFTGLLPNEMFKDKALVDVRLEYNSLTGPLPDDVHQLHKLEVLSLGNNDLNGTIPDVFHHVTHLIALDLHKNEFTGSLPPSLGELKKMEHLLLDHNELTGTLSADLLGMANLRTLVLHHNKLEGSLPTAVNGLANLQDLWLNHNTFVGPIPKELGDCENLVNVYLHDNGFTGALPSSFEGLEKLGSLRIYHNDLTGEISEEICALKKEQSLSYIAADCDADTDSSSGAAVDCDCCDKCY